MAKEIKVREVKPEEIKLDDRNLNRHTDKGRDLVNKSFSELGAGRSGVSDRNGKMIAGNLSIETAIEKGLKIVEVETEGDTYIVVKRKDLDLDSTTDNRARKLALADNSTAAVSLDWDFEEMQTQAEEFGFELGEWGVEMPEDEEVIAEAAEDDGPGALPEAGVTVRGDVWELVSVEKGLRHRVMCGDSTSVDDWDKLTERVNADLLITDPPYGVAYVGKTKDALTIQNDSLTGDQTHELWNDALTVALLNLKEGAGIYATVPAGLLQVGFMEVMQRHECLRQCMVWDKGQMVLGHSDYHYEHEPILYGWKPGGSHYFTSDRTKTTLFRFKKPTRNDLHPTMKPVELWAEMISNSTKKGVIIIDSFLGSGTTLIACEQLHRHCRGMELDEKYCDVIVRRWIAQMEKDGNKYEILLNGNPSPDKVKQLLKQDGIEGTGEE